MADTVRDALSRVSGIPAKEVNEIWEQVKANHARMAACFGPHDFSIEAERTGTLVRKWRCSKCLGEIDTVHKNYYEEGLRHGRAEPR